MSSHPSVDLIVTALRTVERRDGHDAMVRTAADFIYAASAILAREAGLEVAGSVLGRAAELLPERRGDVRKLLELVT